jgi:hypothetical protein
MKNAAPPIPAIAAIAITAMTVILIPPSPPPPLPAVTFRVNVWFVEVPLLAVTVNEYVPAAVDEAMVITPVDEPIVTPAGAPVSEYVIDTGDPVAVTLNVPPAPDATVVLFADVIVGAPVTVRVNDCEVFAPLTAMTRKVYCPAAVDEAIAITPVDVFIVTPAGIVPASAYDIDEGNPLAVTPNVPPVPDATVVLFADVIVGAPRDCTGVELPIVVPFPSWPAGLEPHAHTVPSSFSARARLLPADIAVTPLKIPTLFSPFTCTGAVRLVSVPSPS